MATAPDTHPLPFIHPDDMPDVHAMPGYGRCMEPLIADGALLVFDKRETPEPGDVVSVIFTREAARRWNLPGLIKKLARPLPLAEVPGGCVGLVVVEQINPPRRYTIPSTDVLGVHKFIATAERREDGTTWYRRPREARHG